MSCICGSMYVVLVRFESQCSISGQTDTSSHWPLPPTMELSGLLPHIGETGTLSAVVGVQTRSWPCMGTVACYHYQGRRALP